jgi:hypothetical protein
VIITDTTKHERLGQLLDKALDYPREAVTRGRRCPPPPFGRTERYTRPLDPDGDTFPTLEIPTLVSNSVANSNRLTALERAEYAQLIAGAQSSSTGESPNAKSTAR